MANFMQPDKTETIKNYINKSKDTLIDAEIAFVNLRFDNALNRIYYAIFNIVIALAYLNNFITSKHQTLMGWFNKKFIYEEKIFPEKIYSIYKEAYENRQSADYSIHINYTKEEIEHYLINAKEFISRIETYILDSLKKNI